PGGGGPGLAPPGPNLRGVAGPLARVGPASPPVLPIGVNLAGQDHQARVYACEASDVEAAGRSALADDLCAAAGSPGAGGPPGWLLQARSPGVRNGGGRARAGGGLAAGGAPAPPAGPPRPEAGGRGVAALKPPPPG